MTAGAEPTRRRFGIRAASLCVIACSIAIGCGGGAVVAEESDAPASPDEIVAYRDSGEWERGIAAATEAATDVLAENLTPRTRRGPAVVLDVDDTSLSSYNCLKRNDFERGGAECAAAGTLPAIPQTRAFFRFARAHDVAVLFITGRREQARRTTRANLRRAGYRGRFQLFMRPNREEPGRHAGWKARTRRKLVRRGYRIVVNLGDQASDLRGGSAEHAFKLPNPMYVIPEA